MASQRRTGGWVTGTQRYVLALLSAVPLGTGRRGAVRRTKADSQRAHRHARYDARRLSSGIRLHETRNASLGSPRARGHRVRAGDDQRAAHAARALHDFHRTLSAASSRPRQRGPRSRRRPDHAGGGSARARECVRARSSDRLSSVTIAGWLRDSTPIQRLRGSVCVTATGGRRHLVVDDALEWLQRQDGPFFAWIHLLRCARPVRTAGAVSHDVPGRSVPGSTGGARRASRPSGARPRAHITCWIARCSSSQAITASLSGSTVKTVTASSCIRARCASRSSCGSPGSPPRRVDGCHPAC